MLILITLLFGLMLDRPEPASVGTRQVNVTQISTDGTVTSLGVLPRATAASLLPLRDGRIMVAYQWFPEDIPIDFARIAVRFSADQGRTWTEPSPTQMQGMTVGTRPAFDPALVMAPNGSIRMFFSLMKGERYADEQPAIGSAESRDGVIWQYQRGDRLTLEQQPAYQSTATWTGSEWILIVPSVSGLSGVLASSRDGLVFRAERQLPILEPGQQWRGSVLHDGQGLRFFGTLQDDSTDTIWTARMKDDGTWVSGPRWAVPGEDPGVAVLPDKSLLLVTSVTNPILPTPAATPAPPAPPVVVHETPDEIRSHLNALIESASELDYPRFANLFAPAATAVVSTPENVRRLESGDHIVTTFKPALVSGATWPPLPRSPGDMRVQTQGDAAVATFETKHPDDQPGWWSVVMKRQDGQWKIHHVHATVMSPGSDYSSAREEANENTEAPDEPSSAAEND